MVTQSVDFTEMNMPVAIPASPNGQHAATTVEGVITTVTITESEGSSGGSTVDARFNHPLGMVSASDGTLFICATNDHKVWKVTPDGKRFTWAGDGTNGSGGDGKLATAAQLSMPRALALDAQGSLYIAEGSRVRKVSPEGKITTVVDDLNDPKGLAFDSKGNLYISEKGRHRVRRVPPNEGRITTVAGRTDEGGFAGDTECATSARLKEPGDLCVDEKDNLYIADYGNNRVRKVDRHGIITTFAGGGNEAGEGKLATDTQLEEPNALAWDVDGSLYVAEWRRERVRKVDPKGNITTFAGTGRREHGGDGGQATEAQLRDPQALALDPYGNLYIACGTSDGRVRKVAAAPERSLMIRQVKVPQASLGETADLTLEITACRTGWAVDAGNVVQRFTAPTGFTFAEWPTYSYNGDDAREGSLGSWFERDRGVMVVTSNLHLNTCAWDKGPLIYTVPVKAVAAVDPGTYHDGQLLVGRRPVVRLSATVTGGPRFSVEPGGSPVELVQGGLRYPGVEVRGDGPVPPQTITVTLPPGAGLAFHPERGTRHELTVSSASWAAEQKYDAELSDDAQTLTCRNVDLGLSQQHPVSVVWAAVTATTAAATGSAHLAFRVGGIESSSTELKVVEGVTAPASRLT
ncbi:SMP-30/gluconolactonase/LRE family protein [Streptomyces incarnatus]|uniref:NHL domain-containing protein n=1 Tax=Streptomyces incarnatus TaxID=665007 RepID=UPI000A934EFA|nr:SMP-30/gluconolactonase/LRE family protein [Streptomyces incarnatus]